MTDIAMREFTNATGITRDATNTYVIYAEDMNEIKDALTDGTKTLNAEAVKINGSTVLGTSGQLLANPGGADADSSIQGDTDTALLYIDAGNDRVGISTSTPAALLDVAGASVYGAQASGDYFAVSAAGIPTYVDSDIGTCAVVLCHKDTVAYTDTSAKTLCTLPADAVIHDIQVVITTQFDDTGTDVLDLGITGTAALFADDLNVAQAAGTWLDGLATLGTQYKFAAATAVIATYTGQNSNATAGAADIYIYFTRH